MSIRRRVAVTTARLAGRISRATGHGGTALPGLVGQRLAPGLLGHLLSKLPLGHALISATNGKTTTAHLVGAMLREAGWEPLRNQAGSNLERGLLASLLAHVDAQGRVRASAATVGIFEVDEAAVPAVTEAAAPRVVALGNLFRDQLDRYGEVDWVAALWSRAVGRLPPQTVVVLNSDDPLVASLGHDGRCRTLYYGIEDLAVARPSRPHASDSHACPTCGQDYTYAGVFYSHLGHYRCAPCGRERPRPHVSATQVHTRGLRGCSARMETPEGAFALDLRLPGLYNLHNALAATATALALGAPLDAIQRALASVAPAFGRGETAEVEGRQVAILLVKNPVGFSETLKAVFDEAGQRHLLLALNDGIADGRDVSWIWDADVEPALGRCASLVIGGNRAHDLALRFKYAAASAGQDEPQPTVVAGDVRQALDVALERTPQGETLYVLPTYTAMLTLREVVARRAGLRRFWESG
ncbi:MAG: DUF1727 domain-containing protein [Chloroflexi bacterium]|nr:DUF1727 domain-containing protein [Chloroflexota bacterium]